MLCVLPSEPKFKQTVYIQRFILNKKYAHFSVVNVLSSEKTEQLLTYCLFGLSRSSLYVDLIYDW